MHQSIISGKSPNYYFQANSNWKLQNKIFALWWSMWIYFFQFDNIWIGSENWNFSVLPAGTYIKSLICHRCHITVYCTSLTSFFAVLSPQVGGCANRMHEEQGIGQVFSRAPGIFEALLAPGLLPAQASAEDPQVPPTAARMSVVSPTQKRTHLHINNYSLPTEMPAQVLTCKRSGYTHH